MNDGRVIIEVGLNESVSKAAHPHVPHTPAECAADARRCADAGAAIVHWHAVDAAGTHQLGDAALYGAALDLMEGCVLAYPSYRTDVPDTVDERLGHCLALRARHGMELAPIDVATVNLVLWDPSTRALGPLEAVGGYETIRNSLPFVGDALARYAEVGLVPTVAAFDLGSTRTIAALAEAGLLRAPVLCKIFLWEQPAIGPEPSVEALDLHLRQLRDPLDVEWILVPYGMTDATRFELLARAALERGGGVRVGVGDNPVAFAGCTNAELVDRVVHWAAAAGRSVMPVADLRSRLGTRPV